MASTGKDAWEKHFKGKGDVQTVMKKKSPLLDEQLRNVGNIEAGSPITFLATDTYNEKCPIEYREKKYYVTFNNVQKPKSKLVSGIKLKPQDFKLLKKESLKADELAKGLIDEIEERQDLEADLKTYLIMLTKYWAKIDNTSAADVRKTFGDFRGINEIQKDYGEMLGAIACVKHKIMAPQVKLSTNPTLIFPLRGNEPIVDYYIQDSQKVRYSISAKSGSTTNTLKPADVITLLEQKNLLRKYNTSKVKKILEMISQYSTVQFPFQAINEVEGRKVLSNKALQAASKIKFSDFQKTNYDYELFADLIDLIKIPNSKGQPKIGEIFYYTEKYIIGKVNKDANPTNIFKDATSGLVIYVKYSIGNSNPIGDFSVMMSELQDSVKKVVFRSKNSTNRASDKVGLQP